MCSSVSPSITVPRLNSIGHASLPGCSTTACPPSWNAPSSKLVRVRMDGLKNTSAIDLPFSSLPSLLRLNNAAWVNSASSSARLQSWVFKKCFSDIDRSFAAYFCCVVRRERRVARNARFLRVKLFPGPKRKNPAAGWVFETGSKTLRLPSENVGFRSAGTRRHAGGHPGGAGVVLKGVCVHRARILARMRARRNRCGPHRGGATMASGMYGVTETRIRSRLPGSSGSRERYLVPL